MTRGNDLLPFRALDQRQDAVDGLPGAREARVLQLRAHEVVRGVPVLGLGDQDIAALRVGERQQPLCLRLVGGANGETARLIVAEIACHKGPGLHHLRR